MSTPPAKEEKDRSGRSTPTGQNSVNKVTAGKTNGNTVRRTADGLVAQRGLRRKPERVAQPNLAVGGTDNNNGGKIQGKDAKVGKPAAGNVHPKNKTSVQSNKLPVSKISMGTPSAKTSLSAGALKAEEKKIEKPGTRAGSRLDISQMNLYYQTLAHPAETVGVRIPDDYSNDTVTFSLIKRFILTVNSNGVAAVAIGEAVFGNTVDGFFIPNITSSAVGNTSATDHIIGYTNHTAATTSALFSSNTTAGTGSPPLKFTQWTSAGNSVDSLCTDVRLVSAGLSCRSTVGDLNNQGLYNAVSLPRGYLYDNGYTLEGVGVSNIQAMDGVISVPVNTNKGIELTYQPDDEICLTWAPLLRAPTQSNPNDRGMYAPGGFLVCVSGAYATSTIQCTLVCNYEGIPISDQLIFQNAMASVPDDPIAIAEAFNERESDDLAKEGTSGYDGLHTESFRSAKHASHALTYLAALQDSPETDGIAVHGPRVLNFKNKKSKGAKVKEKAQDETMFSQIARIAIGAAERAAPEMLSAML